MSGTDTKFSPKLNSELYDVLEWFVEEVMKRAEDKMLKTNKLEGAHYAAMTELWEELKAQAKK